MKKLSYVLIPFLVFFVSAITGYFMQTNTVWYNSLVQPSWTPPRWVFGPVWTIIYIFVAIVLVRIWNTWDRDALFYTVVALFIINMITHVLWPYLFAQKHLLGASAFDLGVMATTLCILQVLVAKDGMSFAFLMLYTAWSLYAFSLNFGLWMLN